MPTDDRGRGALIVLAATANLVRHDVVEPLHRAGAADSIVTPFDDAAATGTLARLHAIHDAEVGADDGEELAGFAELVEAGPDEETRPPRVRKNSGPVGGVGSDLGNDAGVDRRERDGLDDLGNAVIAPEHVEEVGGGSPVRSGAWILDASSRRKRTGERTIFLDAIGVRRSSIGAERCALPSPRVRLPRSEDIRARQEIEVDPAG